MSNIPATTTSLTLLERIEHLELKCSANAELVTEIESLKAEIGMLREQIFGSQAPAAVRQVKVVGITHSSDGRRHLSPEAKANISAALKRKFAEKKALKLAQAPAETK